MEVMLETNVDWQFRVINNDELTDFIYNMEP